jgi:NAD(P)H-hydrate epimerase
MRWVTVEQMKDLEKQANESGLSYEKMMENAGTKLAETIHVRYAHVPGRAIIGLIGSGNNGGDALVALNWLAERGWICTALLVKTRVDGDPLLEKFLKKGGRAIALQQVKTVQALRSLLAEHGFILDGIIGTGIKLPLKEDIALTLANIKNALQKQIVIAVDCPSGIDCDSGEAAKETLPASLTVCMEAVKAGMLKVPAYELCGEIVVVPIGLTGKLAEKKSDNFVINARWVAGHLPTRRLDGHKKTFGTVLVVGGSANYLGAPMFSGMAAYRCGAGLVTLAAPRIVQLTMAGALPEATWYILDDENGVISEESAPLLFEPMKTANCMVVGPGIGREETTKKFLSRWLLQQDANKQNGSFGFVPNVSTKTKQNVAYPPMVIDADALRWLSGETNWSQNKALKLVLTPHVGEMSALTGLSPEEIQQNREAVAAEYARMWGQVVVLKGAFTVVAAPSGQVAIVPVANSALAKAGSGDALSGIIAALIAQGSSAFEAACAGAWIHARAGEVVAEGQGNEFSLLVREIINDLPRVFAELNKITA